MSWRTSRPRPAPIAARTAISRRRAAPRVNIRLATLAQTISSTQATAPRKIRSGRRRSPTRSWRRGTASARQSTVVVRVFPLQPRRDHVEILLRLLHGQPRLDPSDGTGVEAVSPRQARLLGHQRNPGLAPIGESEARRHHSHHLSGVAVHGDRAVHDVGLPPIAALPECVAEQNDPGAVGLLLLRNKTSPQGGANPEQRKEVRGNPGTVDSLRFPLTRKRHGVAGVHAQLGKGPVVVAPGDIVGPGNVDPVLIGFRQPGIDRRQLFGVGVRQRSDHDRVDRAQDRAGDSDAQADAQDGHQAEARILEQVSEPETSVLQHVSPYLPASDPLAPSGVNGNTGVPHGGKLAEAPGSFFPRGGFGPARGDQVAHPHLEVKADFGVHVLADVGAPEAKLFPPGSHPVRSAGSGSGAPFPPRRPAGPSSGLLPGAGAGPGR